MQKIVKLISQGNVRIFREQNATNTMSKLFRNECKEGCQVKRSSIKHKKTIFSCYIERRPNGA